MRLQFRGIFAYDLLPHVCFSFSHTLGRTLYSAVPSRLLPGSVPTVGNEKGRKGDEILSSLVLCQWIKLSSVTIIIRYTFTVTIIYSD